MAKVYQKEGSYPDTRSANARGGYAAAAFLKFPR
jgi:hypothetical protein